jgi:hypothetical protein
VKSNLPPTYNDEFLTAYKEAAEWSSTHQADEGSDPINIDRLNLSWSAEAEKQAREWCNEFIDTNAADLEACGLSADSAGHDFWLTSAGHGAGFWDRGIGEIGTRLSEASKPYCADLHVGDDQKIHLS